MTNFEMTNFEKKNFDVNPERPASRVCLNSFIFRIISGFQCNYFDNEKNYFGLARAFLMICRGKWVGNA